MVNATVARNIVGIIGNVISLFLFASPIPTLKRIYKKGSVEEYKADPYLATVLNCALWVFYGLPMVTPDSTLVLTINAIGLLIELFYLSFYLFFAPKSRKVKVGIWIVVEMAFVGIVATLTLKFFHTHKQRSSLVGILCVVFVSLMYISPLTIMGKVIKTKSVKYMPFYLSLANFLNGLVWVIYALIKFDLFILIGNGLGTLSGAVQLILYACYYKTTPKDDEEEEENNNSKPSELQLSGSRGQAARASA